MAVLRRARCIVVHCQMGRLFLPRFPRRRRRGRACTCKFAGAHIRISTKRSATRQPRTALGKDVAILFSRVVGTIADQITGAGEEGPHILAGWARYFAGVAWLPGLRSTHALLKRANFEPAAVTYVPLLQCYVCELTSAPTQKKNGGVT